MIRDTNFFSMDKGETDIQMVYNGTSCRLNDLLHAPHFGLPTVRETLRRWHRNWMGLRDSPYGSLQWQVWLKLEVYRDRRVLSNPFHWDHGELNLPGSRGYRADLPWL